MRRRVKKPLLTQRKLRVWYFGKWLIPCIAIGLLCLLSYCAYETKRVPTALANLPLIKADPSPFKVKPKEKGGMVIENQHRHIYDVITGEDILPEAVQMVEMAEKPLDVRRIWDLDNDSKNADIEFAGEIADAPIIHLRPDAISAILISKATKPKPKQYKMLTSGVMVQLGSYSTREDAEKGWKILRKKFQGLEKLKHDISRVELKAKGTFFRLKAGKLVSEKVARELCVLLAKEGQACLVVMP